MTNVIISSAGRRVALVRLFQYELKKIFSAGKVIAIDSKPELSAACRIADKSFKVPRLSDERYMERLLELCIEHNVGLLIPTIDTELLLYANHKRSFQKYGINIMVSDSDFIRICRDKRKTHKFFDEVGLDRAKEFSRDELSFPLFMKPLDGSSGINTGVFETREDLSPSLLLNENLMFLEYFSPDEHEEITIDMYFSNTGDLKCIVPRKRIEIRGGEVSKGITIKDNLISVIESRFRHTKGIVGCITLQVFRNKTTRNVIGIEINPRFGGGYPLSYAAGANFPKWILAECFLKSSPVSFYEWEENLLMLRYDEQILVKNYG